MANRVEKLLLGLSILILIGIGILLWRVEACGCGKEKYGKSWADQLHAIGTHHPHPHVGTSCIDCYGIPDFHQRMKCLDTCPDASPCMKCQRTCWDQHPKVGGSLDGCLDACGKQYKLCY